MRNIKLQLLFSHLSLAFMMVVVMAGAVYNFIHLGRSVDKILKDNYKSVIAAQNMKEALERLDSAATFLLAGQIQKARDQYKTNEPRFMDAYGFESHNITEKGEQLLADEIGNEYAIYKAALERLLYSNPQMPSEEARKFYFNKLEPSFIRLKERAQGVLDINQAAIVRADRSAIAEARRASISGVGVTISAFLLAIFFAFRMVKSSLLPLRSLAMQAEEIGAGHLNQRIELHRSDEIGALAASFNSMAEKLREARKIEAQRLQRAERMSDAALENLYDPVIVTDAKGNVVHLNRAAEGLFGPEERAVNRSINVVVHDSRIVQAVERAIRQERISALEGEEGFVSILTGNDQRVYRLRAAPMRDEEGALLGATTVLEDMTHQRELDRLKTEFIGVASHELRTPVTSLLLSVQLLTEEAAGKLTPEQQQLIESQKQDLQRLDRLMRDLLDITRLEAGVIPPRFEILSVKELIDTAVKSVSASAQEKNQGLSVRIEENLPAVRADRGQMSRVIINLLNNAIRHTPEQGEIKIEADVKEQEVQIKIIDNGVGIPSEYHKSIFDRFVQVPGATRGGAGLGLAIAQTIVHAHGGEIKVDSEPGKGSTFTVSVPASK